MARAPLIDHFSARCTGGADSVCTSLPWHASRQAVLEEKLPVLDEVERGFKDALTGCPGRVGVVCVCVFRARGLSPSCVGPSPDSALGRSCSVTSAMWCCWLHFLSGCGDPPRFMHDGVVLKNRSRADSIGWPSGELYLRAEVAGGASRFLLPRGGSAIRLEASSGPGGRGARGGGGAVPGADCRDDGPHLRQRRRRAARPGRRFDHIHHRGHDGRRLCAPATCRIRRPPAARGVIRGSPDAQQGHRNNVGGACDEVEHDAIGSQLRTTLLGHCVILGRGVMSQPSKRCVLPLSSSACLFCSHLGYSSCSHQCGCGA